MFVEGGQSAVYDGIYFAAQLLLDQAKKQPDNRFAIVLVSDGANRNSYYTQKQLFSLITGTDIQVFAIGLTRDLNGNSPTFDSNQTSSERDRAEKFLRTLAARTGGAAYILGKKYTTDDVKDAVVSLIDELRRPMSSDIPRPIKSTTAKPENSASRSPTPQPPKNAPPSSGTLSPFQRISSAGDVVYDSFLGRGITDVATENLKRNWIGSEISAEYYGSCDGMTCRRWLSPATSLVQN